jgi:hypothetical protein
VDFDLRGWIFLSPIDDPTGRRSPDELGGIRVARKCNRLHFLHASGGYRAAHGQLGQYVLHFLNGQQLEIPIIYGESVGDWWSAGDQRDFKSTDPPTFEVVWTGFNEFSRAWYASPIRLFKMTWTNSHPDWEVKTVDAVAGNGDLMLFAISTE